MTIKVAYFFMLDRSKASSPQGYGMQLPVQTVAPFYEPLNKDCRFAKLSYPDYTAYCFSFFRQLYLVDILVLITELSYDPPAVLHKRYSKRVAEILNMEETDFYHASYLRRALWINETLDDQEYRKVLRLFNGKPVPLPSDEERGQFERFSLINHPDGFIFSGPEESDFTRSLALYSMGLAYHQQLSRQINRAAEAASYGHETLLRVKQDAYGFKAQYYFNNPVKPAYRDFFRAYGFLTQDQALDGLITEFKQKLTAVSDFARVRAERSRLRTQVPDTADAEPLVDASPEPQPKLVPHARPKKLLGMTVILVALVVLMATESGVALWQLLKG